MSTSGIIEAYLEGALFSPIEELSRDPYPARMGGAAGAAEGASVTATLVGAGCRAWTGLMQQQDEVRRDERDE